MKKWMGALALMFVASLSDFAQADCHGTNWNFVGYYWSVGDCQQASGEDGYAYYEVEVASCTDSQGNRQDCLECWGTSSETCCSGPGC